MVLQPLDLPLSERNLIEIAGPCSVESREQIMQTAESLAKAGIKILRGGIWKPRTHPGDFEGIGQTALPWLVEAGRCNHMLTATEVASAKHVELAKEAGVDILWIGARTTANPFLVQEIAEAISGIDKECRILVKNPVSPDLELWIGALERFSNAGITRLGAIHRGFTLYGEEKYRNSPIWQIPIELKMRIPQLPVVHDPSHTGGKQMLVKQLVADAAEMGFDGLMVETHINPPEALSDANQQLTPGQLLEQLEKIIPANHANTLTSATKLNLSQLRSEIDSIDNQIIELTGKRMQICRQIGKVKRNRGLKVIQPERFNAMVEARKETGRRAGLDEAFTVKLMKHLHEESVKEQLRKF